MALTSPASERFSFGPNVTLEVRGDGATLRHFRREYGDAGTASGGEAEASIGFGSRGDGAATLHGGHKTVGWEVGLPAHGAGPLDAGIVLRGRPLGFARSLVQGYFVEPLLALAAVRRDCVLLPAAAFEEDGRALLLVGASGVGKTTLSARAAAAGWRMLGDDHVLVDALGRCWPFPRRMRIYTDLRGTAPAAYRRLGIAPRAALAALTGVRTITLGHIAPSLPVSPMQLGPAYDPSALQLGRVAVIERETGTESIESAFVGTTAALTAAGEVIGRQREHLAQAGAGWVASLEEARRRELAILEASFSAVSTERLAVADRLDAAQAVDALWDRLGLAAREASGTSVHPA